MLQTGDILLIPGDTWVSPLVKWYLNSMYSHAAMAVNSTEIIEIDMFQNLSKKENPYQQYEVYRYKEGLTKEQEIIIKDFLLKAFRENKGYDWGRILSIIFRYTFHFDVVIDEKNRVICSEIIDQAYQRAGIDLFPDREAGDVTPKDLGESPLLEKVQVL